MSKQPPEIETGHTSKRKKYVTYCIAGALMGGGLYLNFSPDSAPEPVAEESLAPTMGQLQPLPTSDTPDEEPSDSSLLAPVNSPLDEESGSTGEPEAAGAGSGASLDEYNPTRMWLDTAPTGLQAASTPGRPEIEADSHTLAPGGVDDRDALEELGEHDDDHGLSDQHEADEWRADLSSPVATLPNDTDDEDHFDGPEMSGLNEMTVLNDGEEDDLDSSASTDADLTNDVERLSVSRQRIEQRVRRGQIPPSQREEILRSAEFNAVIASIGRRVGEAWYYDGDDHEAHGAILAIELGEDGLASDIRIRRSSGDDAFNNSVLKAAHDSAPFEEVAQLSPTAQTMLNPFSLTFGSMDAIEEFEASWAPQETPDDSEPARIEHATVTAIKREMQRHWPSGFSTNVDHDVSVQITLAVPLGNVSSVDFLRASNSVDTNDQIYQLFRNMPAFTTVRGLSLEDQQAVRQFNVHVTPDGRLR